jgi:hypothetical protein
VQWTTPVAWGCDHRSIPLVRWTALSFLCTGGRPEVRARGATRSIYRLGENGAGMKPKFTSMAISDLIAPTHFLFRTPTSLRCVQLVGFMSCTKRSPRLCMASGTTASTAQPMRANYKGNPRLFTVLGLATGTLRAKYSPQRSLGLVRLGS